MMFARFKKTTFSQIKSAPSFRMFKDFFKELVRVLAFYEGEEISTQTDFVPGQQMVSVVFPDLTLSVNEILFPPLVEGLIKAEKLRSQELEQQAAVDHQRAQEQRQRAQRLAAKLRELGVDPDRI